MQVVSLPDETQTGTIRRELLSSGGVTTTVPALYWNGTPDSLVNDYMRHLTVRVGSYKRLEKIAKLLRGYRFFQHERTLEDGQLDVEFVGSWIQNEVQTATSPGYLFDSLQAVSRFLKWATNEGRLTGKLYRALNRELGRLRPRRARPCKHSKLDGLDFATSNLLTDATEQQSTPPKIEVCVGPVEEPQLSVPLPAPGGTPPSIHTSLATTQFELLAAWFIETGAVLRDITMVKIGELPTVDEIEGAADDQLWYEVFIQGVGRRQTVVEIPHFLAVHSVLYAYWEQERADLPKKYGQSEYLFLAPDGYRLTPEAAAAILGVGVDDRAAPQSWEALSNKRLRGF